MKLLIVLPLLFSSALAHNFTISLSSQPSRVKRAISSDCGCGRTSLRPQNRIVGGEEAIPHSIPYQAFIETEKDGGSYICGGTLLNKRYVLTAMHCLVDVTKITVKLGKHALHQDSEATQKFSVTVISRDDYNDWSLINDIAILKLDRDAELDDYAVIPACLPSNLNELYVGKTAKASGWGEIIDRGSTSNVLKETDVTILAQSDQKCKWSGEKARDKPPTQMCAYRNKTSVCRGDSGGPLAVQENGKYTVVGIVSYSDPDGCTQPGHADVYTRVTKYMDWIRENIADGWCDGSSGPTQAPTTQGLTCHNDMLACNFDWMLRGAMIAYRYGIFPDRFITNNKNFQNHRIPPWAKCDLVTGMCCAPRGFAHC